MFEITYVRLKFHSSRPESFAIYKRTTTRSEWQPWQFYSSSCQETYSLPVRPLIHRNNEAHAICRDDFSDISPLTGASVAFSTLEGRPSAYNFENSAVLQVSTWGNRGGQGGHGPPIIWAKLPDPKYRAKNYNLPPYFFK